MSTAEIHRKSTGGLEEALAQGMKGEVRFDDTSRLLYATDASIYQIMPIGVVIPHDADDVAAAVRTAAEFGVPVLPRGSGTGLAGQTVGAAVVLDCTKYLNRIVELNTEERWVRVQPGVVLDELNAYLKPYGLMFAPDVATSNRASIGGMMGNNSCGAHSILYGRTVDHVLEQRVVLSDGSTAHFAEVSAEEWARRGEGDTLEARIYRETDRICRENADEIDRRFPRIMRRVGGYNLDEVVRRKRYNLARLAVGSEGTLVAVTEAKLNLVPRPKHTGLLISQFDDLIVALRAAQHIVQHGPVAVELIDRIILDLTKGNADLAKARTFLRGDPDAVLATEFYGDTADEVEGRVRDLQGVLERIGLGHAHHPAVHPADQKDVWDVRKAGLGLMMGMKGDAKPAGFVEDTAVPVEHLADYIRDFRDMLRGYRLDACFYAHASVGCIHARPVLNLKDPEDVKRMHEISARVAELVLRYDGVMSAEHGDGIARSEWQELMFGPQIYGAFKELKAAFDPQGIMNPGKIVDAPRMDQHLRYGAKYATFPVLTTLDFERDGGFARSVELCSGVGACRKKTDGTMCPSYRATLEEAHSTRGRANMLRHVLTGAAGNEGLADPKLHEVLDLCLECKACKSECPSNVDMAKLKYEWLSHYNAKHGVPLRSRLVAGSATTGRWGSAFAPLANRVLSWGWVRGLMERQTGMDRRRPLPRYASQTLIQWARRHVPDRRAGSRGEVLLLADTFTNYQEPEIGQAAVRLLEAFGYRVRIPELKCCGRPMISKGLLSEARSHAAYNLRQLLPEMEAGKPLIGLEPSCLVSFKDEYRDFKLGADAETIAGNAWMLEDFLAANHASDEELPYRQMKRRVHLHGHCHQKAILGTARALRALRMVPGYEVQEIASGCCGMAGSFGYEKEHYEISLKIGELSLFPHVRRAGDDALIVAAGTSCRHQIKDGTGRPALHPAQALALALDEVPVR